jgi:hypothetical protein
MNMTGCQWGYVELRCSSRAVRVFRTLSKASGDLYRDPAHSDNDRDHRQNNGPATFGACPGIETDQTGAIQ